MTDHSASKQTKKSSEHEEGIDFAKTRDTQDPPLESKWDAKLLHFEDMIDESGGHWTLLFEHGILMKVINGDVTWIRTKNFVVGGYLPSNAYPLLRFYDPNSIAYQDDNDNSYWTFNGLFITDVHKDEIQVVIAEYLTEYEPFQRSIVRRVMMRNSDLGECFEDSLSKFWTPLPDVWPTIPYLRDAIHNSVQYMEYCAWRDANPDRLRHTRHDSTTSNKDILESAVKRIAGMIQERWLTSQEKAQVYDMDVLIENYNKATINVNPEFYYYDLQPDNVVQKYFAHLHDTTVEQLYSKGGVYDLDALDRMIPRTNCPLFCRKTVMLHYMEKVTKLKPRNDKWYSQMEYLRGVIQKKKK